MQTPPLLPSAEALDCRRTAGRQTGSPTAAGRGELPAPRHSWACQMWGRARRPRRPFIAGEWYGMDEWCVHPPPWFLWGAGIAGGPWCSAAPTQYGNGFSEQQGRLPCVSEAKPYLPVPMAVPVHCMPEGIGRTNEKREPSLPPVLHTFVHGHVHQVPGLCRVLGVQW